MKEVRYRINGTTNKGKLVSAHGLSSVREAIKTFIESYPRFKGSAEIKKYLVEEILPNIFRASYAEYEVIDSFESTKEIKETYLGRRPR